MQQKKADNLKNQQTELEDITIQLNRLMGTKISVDTKIKRTSNSERRARTRTIIQMGSLINMVGLAELCDIQEGEDLQLELSSMNKAAMLLGILSDALTTLPFSKENKMKWTEKGIRLLKQRRFEKLLS